MQIGFIINHSDYNSITGPGGTLENHRQIRRKSEGSTHGPPPGDSGAPGAFFPDFLLCRFPPRLEEAAWGPASSL